MRTTLPINQHRVAHLQLLKAARLSRLLRLHKSLGHQPVAAAGAGGNQVGDTAALEERGVPASALVQALVQLVSVSCMKATRSTCLQVCRREWPWYKVRAGRMKCTNMQ